MEATATVTRDNQGLGIIRTAAAHHETYIYWSMIVMTLRLARTPGPARSQAQPQPT